MAMYTSPLQRKLVGLSYLTDLNESIRGCETQHKHLSFAKIKINLCRGIKVGITIN